MSEKITCPKCGSDQLTANKKGFSGKKAVAGAVLTGGIGLLAGTIGSNQVKITCLACGNSWLPKDLAEQKQKAETEKSINEHHRWKVKFYGKYESGDMAEAERHYRENKVLSTYTPDFHVGYKFLKKNDAQMVWIWVVVFVIILGVVVLITTC